jgi:hypothetical protein
MSVFTLEHMVGTLLVLTVVPVVAVLVAAFVSTRGHR